MPLQCHTPRNFKRHHFNFNLPKMSSMWCWSSCSTSFPPFSVSSLSNSLPCGSQRFLSAKPKHCLGFGSQPFPEVPFFLSQLYFPDGTCDPQSKKKNSNSHPNPIVASMLWMTYHEEDEDNRQRREADSYLTLPIHVDDDNGDYVTLSRSPQEEEEQEEEENPSPSPRANAMPLWYLVNLAVMCMCLGIMGFFVFKWLGPPLIEKVIIPVINWETDIFSRPALAVLVFASVALFPILLLPSSPSMWMAVVTFGYGYGFLLIVPAVAVGVSLPFFIGSFFHYKIEEWLAKYPKRAAVLRAAGRGNWFHQFKAVALIRISPFPYILYNYCAVATDVKYWPYLFGSLVGMQPDIFASIYTGILIRTLANASLKQHTLFAPQISINIVGFSITSGIFFTIYAKRQLRDFQKEEELLLG